MSDNDFDFEDTGVAGPLTFDTFGCDVFHENPDTPDRVPPDVRLTRDFFSGDLRLPGWGEVEIWGFEDDESNVEEPFPSALIRVRQGQVVHSTVKSSKGTHTIHHHGIEPTPFNDGVGHTSFEVSGHYTYQWLASSAGTYFYHCHKNTTLHFEMGMYGFLIVDPPSGPGKAFEGGPDYDVEALWAFDEIDPRWHDLNQDAGLCGEDEGLNDFNPAAFLISGVVAPQSDPLITQSGVAVDAHSGQSILLRVLNAGYTIQSITIGQAGDPLDMQVISVDGRALGGSPPGSEPWSRPFAIVPGQPFELTTAQRYDILLVPSAAGEYSVHVDFLQWIRRKRLGVAETVIRVTTGGTDDPPPDGEDPESEAADTLSVSRSVFRVERRRWRIEGSSSVPGPGNTVTVHVGPNVSGPVLGTASVDTSGSWTLTRRRSSLEPDATRTISVESSEGGKLEGVPVKVRN